MACKAYSTRRYSAPLYLSEIPPMEIRGACVSRSAFFPSFFPPED